MYGLLFLIPAGTAHAASDGRAGHLLFGMLAGMVIGPPLGGRLAEYAGARVTAFSGSVMTLAGLVLIRDLDLVGHPFRVLVGLVLLGAGLGLSSAPAQASAMSSVDAGAAGAAAAVLSTMRYLGGLAGIALLDARPDLAAPQDAYLAAFAAAALLSLWLPARSRGLAPAASFSRS